MNTPVPQSMPVVSGMAGKMTSAVAQVGCTDGRFASTTKLHRRPLPSIVHIASVKQEIIEQAAIAIQLSFGCSGGASPYALYLICGNPPPAPPPPYPRGSAERRVCLEGTRKGSTAALQVARVPGPQPLINEQFFCRTPYQLGRRCQRR
jgi:hypothetical protein